MLKLLNLHKANHPSQESDFIIKSYLITRRPDLIIKRTKDIIINGRFLDRVCCLITKCQVLLYVLYTAEFSVGNAYVITNRMALYMMSLVYRVVYIIVDPHAGLRFKPNRQ